MKCTFYHLTFPSIFRLYEISSVKSWTESRLSFCPINKYCKIQFASAISYSSLDYWHFEHIQMNRMIQICLFSFAASQNWYETFCFDVFYLQITTSIRKHHDLGGFFQNYFEQHLQGKSPPTWFIQSCLLWIFPLNRLSGYMFQFLQIHGSHSGWVKTLVRT